jgi:hypothetical protein
MAGPSFEIPARPSRRYPRGGGVEYAGETVFTLTPDPARDTATLDRAVQQVLAGDRYVYGDWFELPMPLYLVNDDETGDVFRVAVRDGTVELHVLPATDSPGLRAFYDCLARQESVEWRVECRVDQ